MLNSRVSQLEVMVELMNELKDKAEEIENCIGQWKSSKKDQEVKRKEMNENRI